MQTPLPPEKPEDAKETAQRIRNKALQAYTQEAVEEQEQPQKPSVPALSEQPSDAGEIPTLKL